MSKSTKKKPIEYFNVDEFGKHYKSDTTKSKTSYNMPIVNISKFTPKGKRGVNSL